MTFADYLIETGTNYEKAAKELAISKAYVGQLAHLKSTPGLRLAVRIFDWSKGKVSIEGWLR